VIEHLTLQNLLTFGAFIVVGGYAVVRVIQYLIEEKKSLIEAIRAEKEYSRGTERTLREVHTTTMSLNKDVVVAIDKNTKAVETVAELVRSCGVGRG